MSALTIRPLRVDEIETFVRLSHYAFDGRPIEQRLADFGRRVEAERNVLVATVDDEIVSQVMIYEFGIWIDGVRYPTGGLANVATPPERARQGYASRLLRAVLAWMREELGQCLSTLYPTLQPLYAGLGWALAEQAARYNGPPEAFRPAPNLPADPGGRIERRQARFDDIAVLEPIYRRFAQPRSGYLDRPRWVWEDMVLRRYRTREFPWLALWRGSDGEPTGYVLYYLPDTPQGAAQVRELISLTPAGYHGLLTFLATHHLWTAIELEGGADVPWRSLVANPHHLEGQVPSRSHAMLRVVDLPTAVGRRAVLGSGSLRDVTLQVDDHAAPWNDGIWRVGVQAEGTGRRWVCERAPEREPDATVDVATLSALFCGFASVYQAVDIGTLRLHHAAALDSLAALFATRYPPHSKDHF